MEAKAAALPLTGKEKKRGHGLFVFFAHAGEEHAEQFHALFLHLALEGGDGGGDFGGEQPSPERASTTGAPMLAATQVFRVFSNAALLPVKSVPSQSTKSALAAASL